MVILNMKMSDKTDVNLFPSDRSTEEPDVRQLSEDVIIESLNASNCVIVYSSHNC